MLRAARMPFERHLSLDRVFALHSAAIKHDLAPRQECLLEGLDKAFVARLPDDRKPNERLLSTLHRLNQVEKLKDGTVPFAVWLGNAFALTQDDAFKIDLMAKVASPQAEPAVEVGQSQPLRPSSHSFLKFCARGLQGLNELEADGPNMLKTLQGPMDVRKWVLLSALDLFLLVLNGNSTPPWGPRIKHLTPLNLSPAQQSALGSTDVVLSVDVSVPPEDVRVDGQAPSTLSLERLGVTFNICRNEHGGLVLRILRFEADGRDFTNGERTKENQDLCLAVKVIIKIVNRILASARAPRLMYRSKSTLSDDARSVLDIVTNYSLTHGTWTPPNEVLLSVPSGESARKTAEALIGSLARDAYLTSATGAIAPTLKGLMTCTRAGEVAGFVIRLLDYMKFRAEQERSRFTSYGIDDLCAANVCGLGDGNLALICIERFRLGYSAAGTSWSIPDDIVDLRSINDIQGLLARCERLRQQQEAERARVAGATNTSAPNKVSGGDRPIVILGGSSGNINVTGDNNQLNVNIPSKSIRPRPRR